MGYLAQKLWDGAQKLWDLTRWGAQLVPWAASCCYTGVMGVVQGGIHTQDEGRGGRTRGGEEDGAASVTLLAQRT